jgi:hypothetical protein
LEFKDFGGGYGAETVREEPAYVPKHRGPVIDYYVTSLSTKDTYITQDLDDVVSRLRLNATEVDALLGAGQENKPYTKGLYSVRIEGLASLQQSQQWQEQLEQLGQATGVIV